MQALSTDLLTSRFFVRNDPRVDHLVFRIPPEWWSRPYEYRWAMDFCDPEDVALDAGCGLGHPFKFYLADVCKQAHACDIDDMMDYPQKILTELAKAVGLDDAFVQRYLTRVIWTKASLTALPYGDSTFDKIYCLSVIEHLPLEDIKKGLEEFARTLKPKGLIILTFDHPAVDLATLSKLAAASGLVYAGPASFSLPPDAVWSSLYGLHCGRAVLRKGP